MAAFFLTVRLGTEWFEASKIYVYSIPYQFLNRHIPLLDTSHFIELQVAL